MMKVKILAGVMAAAMSLSLYAADTSINISGRVVASPCVVNGGNANLAVPLGDIQASDLNAVGSSSQPVDFTLDLTGCPFGTSSVVTSFSGTSDPGAGANYYKNTGTAGSVAVALIQTSTGNLKGSGSTITQSIASGTASIALKAKAYSSAGGATPGTILATVVATMTYN